MKNKNNRFMKVIINVVLAITILIVVGSVYNTFAGVKTEKISYNEFEEKLENGDIKTITSQNQGTNYLYEGEYSKDVTGENGETQYQAMIPNNDLATYGILDYVNENQIEYTEKKPSATFDILFNVLFLLAPMLLIFFLLTRVNGGGAMNKLSSNKAKLSNVKGKGFDDVAGYEEEKQELVEVVEFLKKPKAFLEMGAKTPKGILLVGPPGTGKTLLAKAVASEANVPFYTISGSDFVEMYVGLGASRVRELFKEIKKSRPAMLFIDEIDAVGRKRGNGHSGGNDEREQTLNQLLVEMDGFETNTGLVIMAATNRADVLDDALLRPGRFDRQVEVSLPDLKTREKILRLHAARIKYSNKIDFEEIARNTSGMSGAELANIINEAAILAVREGKKGVGKEEMREAIDRVIVGLAKKSRKYTEKDKQIVSYHESGHVIAGIVTSNGKEVEKVTIVPRGNAGGYAIHSETEERFFRTKDDYLDEITVFLAGRAAEEIFVKEISGGAHNDFEHATKIARAMVTELGMTELGIYQYNLREEQMFGLPPKYSEKSAMLIDEKIKEILDFCYDRVTKILLEHSEQMHTMARVLRERESLSRKEILSVYNNGKIESEITEDEEFIVPENKINSFKEEVHNKITKLREFQTGRDYTPSELIHDYEANIYEEYKLYAENMNKLSDIDLTVDEKIKLNEFKAIEVKVTNVVVDYIFEEIVPTLNTNPDQRRLELKIKQRNQIIAKSKNADTAVISDVQIENVIQVEEMLKVRPKETLTEEEKKRINYYYDTILYLGRF